METTTEGEGKKNNIITSNATLPQESVAAFGGVKVWSIVMAVYLSVFSYTGYIAFWPMEFNDPDYTIKKYIEIIDQYDKNTTEGNRHDFKPVIEQLMQKSEEAANNMQSLASQSFNIVLGSFLAFLSATVTMIFQSRK